jgi:hypothetical protein
MRSRELADDEERIYRRFKYHYHQGSLDPIFEIYRGRAIDHHKKWVRKPNAERDVLPSITGVPRAATGIERDELRRLLVTVLDEFNPWSPKLSLQPIPEFRHGVSSAQGQSEPRKQLSPKRHGAGLPPEYSPPKKAKSFAVGDTTASHNLSSSRIGRGRPYHSFSEPSRNTSRGTAVFSHHDSMRMASQLTQTTVEASSQEKSRHEGQLRYLRQESPTPGSINPLMESRDQVEVNQDLQDDVRHLLDSSSPTYAYSDFSDFLDEDEIEACLDQSTHSSRRTPIDQHLSAADLKLDERLRASWRKSSLVYLA